MNDTTKTQSADGPPVLTPGLNPQIPVPVAPVRSAEEERLAKFVQLIAEAGRVGLPPGRTTEQAVLMALTTWKYQITEGIVSYDLKARQYTIEGANPTEADIFDESDICVLRPDPTYKRSIHYIREPSAPRRSRMPDM